MIDEMKEILNLSYYEYIETLNNKYGKVKGDYYKPENYESFRNGLCKNLRPNKKIRKGSLGLDIHHVKEIEIENLSSPSKIKSSEIPFSTQESKNLVYCNILEHAILHCMITEYNFKENDSLLGLSGYLSLKGKLRNYNIYDYSENPNVAPYLGALEGYLPCLGQLIKLMDYRLNKLKIKTEKIIYN